MTVNKAPSSIVFKIGIVFLVIACLWWLFILVVPFLEVGTEAKAGLVAAALIFGEVFFWIGTVMVGKEVVTRYKKYLNPKNWKKSSNTSTDAVKKSRES